MRVGNCIQVTVFCPGFTFIQSLQAIGRQLPMICSFLQRVAQPNLSQTDA